jgi:hypothetical protein
MLDLNFVYKQKKHVRQMQVLDTVSNWEFKYNDFFIISITPMFLILPVPSLDKGGGVELVLTSQ